MMISHGATESCKGVGALCRVFVNRGLLSAEFKARFRQCPVCDHGAHLEYYSMSFQLSSTMRNVSM